MTSGHSEADGLAGLKSALTYLRAEAMRLGRRDIADVLDRAVALICCGESSHCPQ